MSAIDDESKSRKLSPYRGFVIAVLALVVVVIGLGLALAAHQGDFAPSRDVSITNNTDQFVNWSCTSTNLHLAPGEAGHLRIPNQPRADFVCVTGSGANEVDTCPDVAAMNGTSRFTVTSWMARFPCP